MVFIFKLNRSTARAKRTHSIRKCYWLENRFSHSTLFPYSYTVVETMLVKFFKRTHEFQIVSYAFIYINIKDFVCTLEFGVWCWLTQKKNREQCTVEKSRKAIELTKIRHQNVFLNVGKKKIEISICYFSRVASSAKMFIEKKNTLGFEMDEQLVKSALYVRCMIFKR